jgi:tetracycline resistance efflux pump
LLGLFFLAESSLIESFISLYELFFGLLTTPWILKTLAFAILVGSIMQLIERSGGIAGFIEYIEGKKRLVSSKRSALMLSYILGVVIFIESSITSLISGAVGRPLCDRYKISHAKLAYVCDSTSAPISSLIILNGWGALLLGLVTTQVTQQELGQAPLSLLFESVLYNLYAMSALFVTFLVIWFDINLGPMKNATTQNITSFAYDKKASMWFMLLPLLLLVVLVFVYMHITGDGSILQGSGSSSIFYTTLTTLVFMNIYYITKKNMNLKEFYTATLEGAIKLFPIAMILLFAFAMGHVSSELKAGEYLAGLASENLSVIFLATIIFLLSSLIAFSTGTSWGTFSIMIPIAVPMALGLDANVALCIGAVISGGVFGDHCSPISDTTIISSLAADCEVIEHVKTQLPYALMSGALASVIFIVLSM